MCLILMLAIGFTAGMWFQARRAAIRAHNQFGFASAQALEAARRIANAANEAERQMYQRAVEGSDCPPSDR
jgi:hypothetical protein